MTQREDFTEKKRVNISITEATHNLLKKIAIRNKATVSKVIEEWVWQEEELYGKVRLDRSWVKDLDIETLERLHTYCYENHTSPAEAVTRWIWGLKVKNATIKGQMTLKM